MRDPDGRLYFEGDVAIRELQPGAAGAAFLQHPSARALVDGGRLVPFAWRTPQCLESPRLPFVSLPTDWCNAQLRAAAALTLEVADEALAGGFELKDASAWNVVFDGVRPVFCDHLSFEPIAARQWWAFGQFCRHFVLPLALAQRRGIPARETFLAHRDGLAPERARRLLGLGGVFSRLGPLLAGARGDDGTAAPTTAAGTPLHASVIRYARACLPRQEAAAASAWTGYVAERGHYGEGAAGHKRERVAAWLRETAPATVLDLGCNTGEFSRIALAQGARVVAIDADHDCVDALFRAAAPQDRLHPFVANVADLHGGRGWAEAEFPGLLARLEGRCEMLMMLALTHHLRFGEGIPLAAIAALAARLTSAHLVLEVIRPDDPMVVRVAAQRRLPTDDFGVEQQVEAFGRHFELVARDPIPGSARELLLMRRRP